ncbi:MAG TPA: ATP-dependent Clp protease adaptor ClpS [Planctomycetota bacterium]|nr:ATP-dependent Clp protease adaptor ClpS [Planctomycetota bacterium]
MPALEQPLLEDEVDTSTEPRLAPLYRVLIHNDDVTPMDFVVRVLGEIFRLSRARSMDVMFQAHFQGVAHVVTEPLERAEFHVDQARSLSRARKYPLTFSVERED